MDWISMCPWFNSKRYHSSFHSARISSDGVRAFFYYKIPFTPTRKVESPQSLFCFQTRSRQPFLPLFCLAMVWNRWVDTAISVAWLCQTAGMAWSSWRFDGMISPRWPKTLMRFLRRNRFADLCERKEHTYSVDCQRYTKTPPFSRKSAQGRSSCKRNDSQRPFFVRKANKRIRHNKRQSNI